MSVKLLLLRNHVRGKLKQTRRYNRYILLDLILLFFIPGPFSMSQFRTIQEPFMTPWWTWPSSSK